MHPGALFAERYRLQARLGSGAFGEVYAAFDEGLLARRVALKLIRQEASAGPEAIARFLAEVQLAGRLNHPHIATVYDAGVWQDRPYMVVELVDGADLGAFLAEHGPLDPDLALRLAGQVAEALACAHAAGVFHRDIKPGNVLIDRDHRARVVDFGLATSATLPAAARAGTSGTPGYAAPEQVRGLPADGRADQFSLAAVTYLLLTGVAPFVGRTLAETLRRTLLGRPEPPSRLRPGLSPGLDRAILRALEKDPAARYPSVSAFARELLEHAAFGQLATPEAIRAELAAAAGAGLVVALGDGLSAEDLARVLPRLDDLGVPLLLDLRADPAPPALASRAWQATVDPREDRYPSADAPLALLLGGADGESSVAALAEAADGPAGLLATCTVLALGLSPADPLLRRVLTTLHARYGRSAAVVAVSARWSLDELRAAERRGVRLLEQAPDALLAGMAADLPARAPAPGPLPERPYKFLSYYDAADERIFRGRGAEVARLHARVLARPLTLLYGASGAGKSSLVRAGLLPRLRRGGARLALARVMDDPLGEICRALGGDPPPEQRADWLAATAAAGPLLVVALDQFEELFLRFSRAAREKLARELRQALEGSEGRLRLLFCIRADYLARVLELKAELPLSLESGLYLEPLGRAAAREAIVEPAALLGVAVEEALVDRILVDLVEEGVDPPQLQLVCDHLWEARDPAAGALTLRAYLALGEVRTILARHLDAALQARPEADRAALRAVLKAMVTVRDTRSVRRLSEIARAADLGPERAREHMKTLVDLRLVRPLPRPDGEWYEIAHEVLTAEIARWFSEEDRRIQEVREQLEVALRGYRSLGILLSPAQLRLVGPLAPRLGLSEEERELLRLSRQAQAHGRRTLALGLGLGLLLVLVAVVGARALWLRGRAFARVEERALTRQLWGELHELPTSTVVVYRGAADPWFLDGWLGYPRDRYETDFQLDDLAPDARDALRRGLDLPGPGQAAEALLARLTPAARLRERIFAGDEITGADLLALAGEPGAGAETALGLVPTLALAGPDPAPLIPAVLELMGQVALTKRVPSGVEPLPEALAGPATVLLNRVPSASWAPLLTAGRESDAELMAILLGAAGRPGDAGPLLGTLDAGWERAARATLRALPRMGACEALPVLRASVASGHARPGMERALYALAGLCGSVDDLPGAIAHASAELARPESMNALSEALHALAPLDLNAVARLIGQLKGDFGRGYVNGDLVWAQLPDPELRGVFPEGSLAFAAAAMYGGDSRATVAGWNASIGDLSQPAHSGALWPVALYRGDALERRAMAALERQDLPTHAVLPLLRVAWNRGDAAAATSLAAWLRSADTMAVWGAIELLATLPVEAPLDPSAPRQARLGRALVALKRGEGPDVALFQSALEDPSASYLEWMIATHALAESWAQADPSAAVAALRSPRARVRLAAIQALAMTPTLPVLEAGGDPWLARAIGRVRWLRSALAVDERLRAESYAALDLGQVSRATQLVSAIRGPSGTLDAMNGALSPSVPALVALRADEEAVLLQVHVDLRRRRGQPIQWLLAYVPSRWQRRLAEDPRLARLRGYYAYEVLAGLRDPATVDDALVADMVDPGRAAPATGGEDAE